MDKGSYLVFAQEFAQGSKKLSVSRMGLFWSNEPATTIGAMIRSIGGEELDRQVERNGRLHATAGAVKPLRD